MKKVLTRGSTGSRARKAPAPELAFLLAAVLGVGLGCGGRKDKSKEKKAEPAKSEQKTDQSSSLGGGMGSLGMLGSMFKASMDTPGPYDEPKESANYQASSKHYVVLELSGSIVELRSFSFLKGMSGTPLRAISDRLRELRERKNLEGLVLRADDLELSMATAEELRGQLAAFKGKGERKLICHTEGLSNTTYYLLSVCDHLGMAPTGTVMISGVAAMPLHVKGLLDKVGVRADFLHIGDFKGAAEPLTRDAPSPAMNQTLEAIMDESYRTMVAGIAAGRKLSSAQVRSLIDTALFQGEAARKAKLVDSIAVYETYRDRSLGKVGWKKLKVTPQRSAGWTQVMEFLGMMPASRPSGDHVAVVYAIGSVVDGKGDDVRQQIASRPLSAALRALAADDSVKAIVLRIDSGGGSALASEIIWNAVAEAKKKKPVVVSMGNVAASGGYYIAAGATKIYANANTLTGSIGVVGGKLAIGGGLAKLGIKAFPRGKGKRSLMWSSMDPWSSSERAAVRSMMEDVYKSFVNRVAQGRGKSYGQVHAIAQGRVWTGAAAKKRGLVDEIGGLDAAIAEARKLGGVALDAELEIYPPKPTIKDIIGAFGAASLPFGLDTAIQQLRVAMGPGHARVLEGMLHQLVSLRSQPVQTALLFPVLFR